MQMVDKSVILQGVKGPDIINSMRMRSIQIIYGDSLIIFHAHPLHKS